MTDTSGIQPTVQVTTTSSSIPSVPPLGVDMPIPPDPTSGHTSNPNATWDQVVGQAVADVGQVISTPTVTVSAAPTVVVDTNGVPHVTYPLTKKTKAYVGTALALISLIGVDTTSLLPASVQPWAVGVVSVAGVIATFLGIVLPTNLPTTPPRKP